MSNKLPYPHLEMLVIDGMENEAVIVKKDISNGDVYYILVKDLDEVDRSRMRTILSKRDAARLECWDLLDHQILPNGVNALEYFDQLVLGITASGIKFKPAMGRRGAVMAPPQPLKEDKKTAKKAE